MCRNREGFCQTCKKCYYIIVSFPPSPSVSLSRGTGTTYINHSHFPLSSGFSLYPSCFSSPGRVPADVALPLGLAKQLWPGGMQALGCVFGWQGRLGLFLLWQVWCIFLDLMRDGSSDSTWSPCLAQLGHRCHASLGGVLHLLGPALKSMEVVGLTQLLWYRPYGKAQLLGTISLW